MPAIRLASRQSIRLPLELGRGQGLPKSGLLIYLARPNSDAYLTGETDETPEGQADWGYVLPAGLFADVGEGIFFDALGDPIVVLASEILADPSVNLNRILFKSKDAVMQTGSLAIYAAAAPTGVLLKAWKVLKNHTVLNADTVLDANTILG